MPDNVSGGRGNVNPNSNPVPTPKFTKGDIVDVNVFRDNASGLFNGVVPKFIFQVFGVGEEVGTWKLVDPGTWNVRIPSCPEDIMKKIN